MTAGRVAVTGVGMVSALGRAAAPSFERLLRGERGLSRLSLFDVEGQRASLVGEVSDFDPAREAPGEDWSRSDALALVAAKEALCAAGLAPGEEALGVSVGVTTAGMLEAEGVLSRLGARDAALEGPALASYPLNSTADRLSRELGASGPIATLSSACSSGANAIVQGALWLHLGRARRVLAGGTDALCRLTLTGFNALGATDPAPCRPFDVQRGGLNLGEGAAFLVLEPEALARRRGAKIYALLTGYAVGAEAHHVTQPDPAARGPAELLRRAMARAGLGPADIDYVNAHGTGTAANDAAEVLALRAVFGEHADRVLVSSSKGQIGHTLGAAGALEAAITVLAIDARRAPPTVGLERTDPGDGLNHVRGVGVDAEIRAAASSSFGFGGTGAVLLFERPSASGAGPAPAELATEAPLELAITAVSTLDAAGEVRSLPGAAEPRGGARLGLVERLEAARSRRFDTTSAMVTLCAQAALDAAGAAREDAGLIVATAFGNVTRTAAFVRTLATRGPRRVPPAEFPHLLPSAPSGNASIYLGLKGPVLATSALEAGGEAAFQLACDWIEAGEAKAFVAGAAEPFDEAIARLFGPPREGRVGPRRGAGGGFLVVESLAEARRRGVAPLALVRSHACLARGGLLRATLTAPRSASRALVFCLEPSAAVDALLTRSGWGSAARGLALRDAGYHDALGAVALVAATSALARGEADEALVVGETAAGVHVVHLGRAR